MKSSRRNICLILVITLFSAMNASSLFGQTLKMQFNFGDSGTTTTDLVSGVVLNLVSNSAPLDFHGAAGSGVGGYGKALYFPNSSYGNAGGAIAQSLGGSGVNLGVLTNYTLTFWLNPTVNLYASTFNRFIIVGTNGVTDQGAANSLAVENNGNRASTNSISAYINANYTSQTVAPIFGNAPIPPNQWTFLAVTYDGTNVTYYNGSTASPVLPISTNQIVNQTINLGGNWNLFLGNRSAGDRAYAGYMADVRLYTGAASSNFVDSVRAAALPPATLFTNTFTGNWSASGSWSGSQPSAGGSAAAAVFCNPSSATLIATNDLAGSFVLNQFSALANTCTLAGNPLSLAVNGSILPLVTNRSGNTLTLATTIALPSGSSATFGGGSGNNITVNGIIAGSGSLVESGAAMLALTNQNTYTGNTTVNGGILNLVTPGSIYSSTFNASSVVTINSGAILQFDNWGYGAGLSFGQLDFGSPRIMVNGGTLRSVALGGSYANRGCNIGSAGGTLDSSVVGQKWTLAYQSSYPNITLGGAMTLTGAGNGEINKNISESALGAGSLIMSGSGIWTLSGTNTYTGSTTINGGVLQIGNGTTDGTITTSSMAISNSGTLIYNIVGNQSYGNVISGSGTLTKTGAGTLTLSGTNTYSGGTTNSAGILEADSNTALGSGLLAMNGGVLSNSISCLLTNNINLSSAGTVGVLTGNTLTIGGIVSGGSGLTKTGNGTLILTNKNTFAGNTTLNGGKIHLVYPGSIYSAAYTASPIVTINSNSILEFDSWSYGLTLCFGGLDFGAARIVVNGGTLRSVAVGGTSDARAFSIGSAGGTLDSSIIGQKWIITYSSSYPDINLNNGLTLTGVGDGEIDKNISESTPGVGSLTMSGSGTWTLAGTNTYTGNTTISGGTMALEANNALPSATTVNLNGGTMAIGSYNNIINAIQTNGVVRAKGTWGAAGSGANHISSSITGTGILTVTTGGSTTTTVTSGGGSTYGGSVTFTAIIIGSSGDGSTPAGTVTFYDNAVSIGTSSLSGSGLSPTATLTTSALTSGTHTITASYGGSASYDLSTSTGYSQVVNKASTTAMLAVNNSPATYNGSGQAAAVSVTSSNTPGAVANIQTGGAATQSNSGTYAVTADYVPANTNYTTLTGLPTGNFVVTQRSTPVGASSTKNPSGYKDAVSFQATLPTDATGSVVFSSTIGSISTNSLSSGTATSLSIINLQRGTNIITAAYSGDGNYLGSTNTLNQIVTNHPPVANVMTVTRTAGLALIIKLSDIATNWSDVDGDPVELTGVTMQSTNGINLFPLNWNTNLDGNIVTTNAYSYLGYTNSPNVNDQINYCIADGFGGTNIGCVNIVIQGSVTGTNSITGHDFTSPYSNTITAYGIPYFYYTLERSTNLALPVWMDVSTNQAAANGVINAVDTFWDLGGAKPSPSAFYQFKWQP